MATYRYVNVTHPEGLRLLDLVGVEFDLERCAAMCRAIQTTTPGSIEMNALAVAIVCVYGRIFKGGVRNQVKIPVEELLSNDDSQFHKSILEMRSKHVAHSINEMEMPALQVWLNPDERGRKVNSVSAALSVLVALSPNEQARVASLCGRILEWVVRERRAEEIRVKGVIEKNFPFDELYAMEATVTKTAGLSSAAKGRSR